MADDGGAAAVPALSMKRPTFLCVDGAVLQHIKDIKDALDEYGLSVVEEFKIALNAEEARTFLNAAKKAEKEFEKMETARKEEEERKKAEEEAAAKKGKGAQKGKGAKRTPRSARSKVSKASDASDASVAGPKPFDTVVRPEEIRSLSKDRCLFMVLEGVGAVGVLQSLLGTGNPDEWERDFGRDALRAQLTPEIDDDGNKAKYNCLHCALNPVHADAVIELMKDLHEQHVILSEETGPKMVKKSPWVNLDFLYEFLFPPGFQHPRSTGRLIVFGMYGPFDDEGKLRAGWRGRHVVTDRELSTMVDEIEREDLLTIFVKEKGMTEDKKLEILRAARPGKPPLPNLSLEQVQDILAPLKRNRSGEVSFHDMQAVIMGARRARLRELKRMYPEQSGAPGRAKVKGKGAAGAGERSPRGGDLAESKGGPADMVGSFKPPPPKFGRGAKLGRRDGVKPKPPQIRKMRDTEGFKVVARLLNRESFKIADIENGNDPALIYNVRLLRDTIDRKDDGWDDVCNVRGSLRGTYVGRKARKPGAS